MGYTPITEEQAQKDAKEQRERFLPWPKDDYDFEIKSSIDAGYSQTNASGNSYPMMALEVIFYNQDGKEKIVKEYLVFGGVMAFKSRHASIACGLQAEYEAGSLMAYMFVGRRGKAHLGITPKQAKKDKTTGAVIAGEFWPEKNTIEDYITEGATQQAAAIPIKGEVIALEGMDDEIPF